jgi:hypothetical protein
MKSPRRNRQARERRVAAAVARQDPGRPPQEQLKRLDAAGLVARKERVKLAKRIQQAVDAAKKPVKTK